MNLFRSEDHARNWSRFNPDSAESIMALADRALVQGTESRRHWLDEDYLSVWYPRRGRERAEAMRELGKMG